MQSSWFVEELMTYNGSKLVWRTYWAITPHCVSQTLMKALWQWVFAHHDITCTEKQKMFLCFSRWTGSWFLLRYGKGFSHRIISRTKSVTWVFWTFQNLLKINFIVLVWGITLQSNVAKKPFINPKCCI